MSATNSQPLITPSGYGDDGRKGHHGDRGHGRGERNQPGAQALMRWLEWARVVATFQVRLPAAEPQLPPLEQLSLITAEAHAQLPSPPNQPAAQQADLAQLAQALLGLSNEQRETIGQKKLFLISDRAREWAANPPRG
ncbi:hypothetical protein V8E54_000561 [Elaphomyces granulatus]